MTGGEAMARIRSAHSLCLGCFDLALFCYRLVLPLAAAAAASLGLIVEVHARQAMVFLSHGCPAQGLRCLSALMSWRLSQVSSAGTPCDALQQYTGCSCTAGRASCTAAMTQIQIQW